MKALRELFEPALRAFQTMPLRQRTFASTMLIAVLAGTSMLLLRNKQPSTEYLFGGRTLADQELDSVEIAFSRAGLNGWQRDEAKIKIPKEKRNEYLAALDDNAALPVSLRSTVQQAIDKASLFESTSQRISRELHAKEQDLGNKLAAFPEIRWASVEHDRGERQGFSGVRTQSASVVVCPEGNSPLPTSRIETIREFIRGSYADMNAEDVVVIDTNADPNSCHITDPIAHRQHEEQARLEQDVLEALKGYCPVRVDAHIDLRVANDLHTATNTQVPHVVVQPTTENKTTAAQDAKPDLLDELFSKVTRVKPKSRGRLIPATSTATAVSTPQVCKPRIGSVHVSIGLPDSYFKNALKQQAASQGAESSTFSTEQLSKIQKLTEANILSAVRPTVLARTSESAGKSIDVYSYPDSHAQTGLALVSEPAISTLGLSTQQILIVGVIGLIVVVILLGSLRSKQTSAPAIGSSRPEPLPTSVQLANVNVDSELTTLVRDNPDRAIEVIQAWLTEAA